MTSIAEAPTAPAPEHTGSRLTRVLGGAVVVSWIAWLTYGLVLSPPDVVQSESVRLFYLHVPLVFAAYLGFTVTLVASIMVLRKASAFWDELAGVGAEVGLVMGVLVLITGAIWGRPTWGTYWVWDPRITTATLLCLVYLGYLVVRRLDMDPAVRARRAAVLGIIAFVNVPITRYSVQIWESLHQEATLSLTDTEMDGAQLTSFALGAVAMSLFATWIMIHRFRVAWLAHELEHSGLEARIEARRGERPSAEVG